ncbi:MAG TPA: helix-turn-helix domain-containing protein, partial [Candidatus Aminicenantes bacterium]|nr:helix-turn-helix domain-containing protein [Candidatus Aminicenantes bacterium]
GQHQSKILSLDSFKKAVGFDLNRSVDLQGKEDAQDLLQGLTSLPTIREMEETLVREALRRSQENQSVAARLLGISRQALNSRLNRRRDEGEPQEGK